MAILETDRFSPTLFIGLGGSGGRVVDTLAGKLARHPNFERFRDLIHFAAVDTNKSDLQSMRRIPDANRFLISSFDRRTYVRRKRGELELREDPQLTQWVHDDYQFRDTQGAGAGQIRVESRLGLYYNLEEDRARIRASLQRMLDAATRPDNPFRDNRDRVINVCVYASVAGGTGSGGFLPIAYLLQDLIRDHGWGRPNVVGTLMLPSVFLNKVEQALHADINANGYAALKELEYVTRLGYEGSIDSIRFHYDPVNPHRDHITRRPFALTYLIDKPAELAIEQYTNAIADSAFLQIFSPILGQQSGEYDNYEKHQKSLALEHFSVHYGTFGAALLVFPRKDLIHYASLRYVAKALDTYLVQGDDEAFRVPWDNPKFQKLSRQEQDRIVDKKFVAYVDHQARLEEENDERGVYSGIRAMQTADGRSLREAFQVHLASLYDGLEERIEIEPFDPMQVHEQNTSLSRPIENLRRDTSSSRSRVMGEYFQSIQTDIRTERFFSEFFRKEKTDPLTQRYFLIRLRDQGKLTPFEDPSDGAYLHETRENPYDLDKEYVSRDVAELEKRLRETSVRGIFKSVLSRENKEFQAARRKVQDFFAQVEGGLRDWLKSSFWQSFHDELQRNIESRLNAFRNVAAIANEATRALSTEAQRFLSDPASAAQHNSDASEYYLDLEVLRDDRHSQRLWDRFFDDRLDRPAYFSEEEIFAAINEAFLPTRNQEGHLRPRDGNEIVGEIRKRLQELGKETFEKVVADSKLNLHSALELEARYVATRNTPYSREALESVSQNTIDAHVRDKLQLVMDQCVLLANIDQSKFDDPTVTPNRIFYAGLASTYTSDEPGSLKSQLDKVVSGVQLVPEWGNEDMLVFYRAMIGIPTYFFHRINNEMAKDYRSVKSRPQRSYPLHIEKAWEDALPNLDPKEIREAEERRLAEEAAAKAAALRAEKIWNFTLNVFLGNVERSDLGYEWVMGSARKKLADTRAGAFEAFNALEQGLRQDFQRKAEQAQKERQSGPRERRRFHEDLSAHLAQLNDLYYQAIANEEEREKRYLEEEKALLEDKLAGMGE